VALFNRKLRWRAAGDVARGEHAQRAALGGRGAGAVGGAGRRCREGSAAGRGGGGRPAAVCNCRWHWECYPRQCEPSPVPPLSTPASAPASAAAPRPATQRRRAPAPEPYTPRRCPLSRPSAAACSPPCPAGCSGSPAPAAGGCSPQSPCTRPETAPGRGGSGSERERRQAFSTALADRLQVGRAGCWPACSPAPGALGSQLRRPACVP
jgi:hypothetical protein